MRTKTIKNCMHKSEEVRIWIYALFFFYPVKLLCIVQSMKLCRSFNRHFLFYDTKYIIKLTTYFYRFRCSLIFYVTSHLSHLHHLVLFTHTQTHMHHGRNNNKKLNKIFTIEIYRMIYSWTTIYRMEAYGTTVTWAYSIPIYMKWKTINHISNVCTLAHISIIFFAHSILPYAWHA